MKFAGTLVEHAARDATLLDPPYQRMDASAEGYFTRSKTMCDAIDPIMPSTVMVLPSALSVVLDVPVPPGPLTEPW
jgi:hypothetical protein